MFRRHDVCKELLVCIGHVCVSTRLQVRYVFARVNLPASLLKMANTPINHPGLAAFLAAFPAINTRVNDQVNDRVDHQRPPVEPNEFDNGHVDVQVNGVRRHLC